MFTNRIRQAMLTAMLVFASHARSEDEPDATAAATGSFKVYGCKDGVIAYATSGGVCNVGSGPLPANLQSSHPMWTQNLYRLGDARFEQLGMSWIKHSAW